ncbi:hypothetical protein V1512DRAFT_292462 [Lipomyces arxii]|uniref:uncharacterized protein n=1 Tax=Lipomyces arxii TaxID=56418 RepID=UPI0034CF8632
MTTAVQQHHRGRSHASVPVDRGQVRPQRHVHSLSRSAIRRASVVSSSSSSSSLSSSGSSVYEAEVFIDVDALDGINYDRPMLDKDESGKLYPATTNGSISQRIEEDTQQQQQQQQVSHQHHSSEQRTGRTSNRNSLIIGSPSSGSMFRSVDYSEYTYDLGWTAASRVHSRNSSVFQLPPPGATLQNASPGAFGSPGFGSPGFLASRHGMRPSSTIEVSNRRFHEGMDDGDDEEDVEPRSSLDSNEPDDQEDSPSLLRFNARLIDVDAGSMASNLQHEPQEGDYLPTHVAGTSPYSATSFININAPADSEHYRDMTDTDLASLIDYASPRVPPFPSTAEAEELLYSRMSSQSRAALAKLLHGRNPAVPRPPRFRPPISQNMGYGAIQRHPFYYAPSRSSSNGRSVQSEPEATSAPAYRQLNRNLVGELGENDVGFWESMKSFFVSECCFCFASEE